MTQTTLFHAPIPHARSNPNKKDQFYTKPEVAQDCYEFLRHKASGFLDWENLLWVEPSAGEGSFYNLLPAERRVGIDIDPRADGLIEQDFLVWDAFSVVKEPKQTAVIGNPPFGHRARLAVAFFNKSADFANTIGFIVPVQFRKYSIHKYLNPEFQWVGTTELPNEAFYTDGEADYRLNAEFQVWTRETGHDLLDMRLYKSPAVKHPDFEMWQYNNTEQALHVFDNDFDFAVPRQGYKDYTRKETDPDNCERTTQWALFKAHSPEALERLLAMDFETLAQNNTITPGFGKACVVKAYKEMTGEQAS